MATYIQAAQARKLIDRVRGLNNNAHRTITDLSILRSDLLSLTQADRDTVIQTITDMGYDPVEIQGILGNWNVVFTTMNAEGIARIAD